MALYQTDYNRDNLRLGIVHLGCGAFHRAHQAVYVDDYIASQHDHGWGIAAVNLRASESADFAKMAAVKEGYILKTMAPDGKTHFRRVRSHKQWVDWTREKSRAAELLALDSVKIVTITVTESGYYLKGEGELDTDSPIIKAELAGGETTSVYGYLAESRHCGLRC